MILNKFKKQGNMPNWLPDNTHYLCIMGSFAYGVSDDTSDMDVYGWAIPPKEYIFPKNIVRGFGKEPHSPNEEKIKQLLIDCLESHYGKIEELEKSVKLSDVLSEMQVVLDKYKV